MGFLGYLLECFIYSRSLYVVRTTFTTGITGYTFPNQKIVKGFLPLTEYDHPDETIRGDARLFPYWATCCTTPTLVTGKKVLT
jgi:hypothetical protein